MEFTWWGHACLEVHGAAGQTILFDPWFGNPRSSKRADQVERCDLLLVTHGHFDHFDPKDALGIASRTRPAWPCIHELSLWLGRNLADGSDGVIGMNKGGSVDAAGCRVTMVHADHSGGDWASEKGAPIYFGEPVGFVVQPDEGETLYFAGDTEVFGDMRLIRELHQPAVVFLPIGGHYTMDPRRAAVAVELLGARVVVPIHHGTFPLLAGTPDQLREELANRGLGDVRVVAPEPGERTNTNG